MPPGAGERGIHAGGGRGRHSLRTPAELAAVAARTGLDGVALAQTSRLVAKVDNAAVQDGFQIYLHAFVVTDDGRWVVVQQGMDGRRWARRYHWLSESVSSFVSAPHAAIAGRRRSGPLVNLVDTRAEGARQATVGVLAEGPETLVRLAREARAAPHLKLPQHHEVRAANVDERRLHAALAAACAAEPGDFPALLATPGVGPRALESLALVAEVIHGAPTRFTDPARFSLAHGGKDGHPFPVPLEVYDATLRVLREAVDQARLGQGDKLAALRGLDDQARRLESVAEGQGVEAYMERERSLSHHYGGMTVQGRARPPRKSKTPGRGRRRVADGQLTLPGL